MLWGQLQIVIALIRGDISSCSQDLGSSCRINALWFAGCSRGHANVGELVIILMVHFRGSHAQSKMISWNKSGACQCENQATLNRERGTWIESPTKLPGSKKSDGRTLCRYPTCGQICSSHKAVKVSSNCNSRCRGTLLLFLIKRISCILNRVTIASKGANTGSWACGGGHKHILLFLCIRYRYQYCTQIDIQYIWNNNIL